MRLYLAGPMSGIKGFNFPAFHAAAKVLRAAGYIIVSPAETDPPEVQAVAIASPDGKYDGAGKVGGETWGDMLARDVKMLADGIPAGGEGGLELLTEREATTIGVDMADYPDMLHIHGIVLLDGWERSRGARLEAFVGTLTKKRFFRYDAETQSAQHMSEGAIMAILFRNRANLQAGVARG